MNDYGLCYKKQSLINFIDSNGKYITTFDIYQIRYSEFIIDIQKLNVTANVSDHYHLLPVLHYQKKNKVGEKSQTPAKTCNNRIKWDKIDT